MTLGNLLPFEGRSPPTNQPGFQTHGTDSWSLDMFNCYKVTNFDPYVKDIYVGRHTEWATFFQKRNLADAC